jgi:hypothetical protein
MIFPIASPFVWFLEAIPKVKGDPERYPHVPETFALYQGEGKDF